MKRTLFVCACLIAAFAAASCASSGAAKSADASAQVNQGGRTLSGSVPKSIRDAAANVPKDAIIGIGTANMATLSMSRTISQTRARAELSRAMDTIVRDMVLDFDDGSEVDHSAVLSFQENVTVALSQSRLAGASIVAEDQDSRGNYWTMVMLRKDNAVNEINQAVAAAKLRAPAMAAFNAQDRMDQAFDKVNSGETGYSDRD